DQRAAERSYGIAEDDLTPCMSWSFVSLRNDWNQRKHTVAVRADGTPRFRCRRDRRPRSPGHGRARSGVSAQCDKASKLCSGCGDLKAAVNTARYAQRETDPSTGVVTGGADRKPPPTGGAGGRETRTRAEVGDNADDGGSASPKGEAA
ncbi:MAG TPA: hypothetical protein VF874_01800, partial [Mycobacterium sp.]